MRSIAPATAPVTSGNDDDTSWSRLQSIFQKHQRKEQADSSSLAVEPTAPLVSESRLPLEAVWPVTLAQDPAATEAAREITSDDSDAGRAATAVTADQEQMIQRQLSQVAPQKATDSSVELLMPSRPRPTRPPQRAAPRSRVEPASSDPGRAPDIPTPALVPTDIGLLPADLWQRLGQAPPGVEETFQPMPAEGDTILQPPLADRHQPAADLPSPSAEMTHEKLAEDDAYLRRSLVDPRRPAAIARETSESGSMPVAPDVDVRPAIAPAVKSESGSQMLPLQRQEATDSTVTQLPQELPPPDALKEISTRTAAAGSSPADSAATITSSQPSAPQPELPPLAPSRPAAVHMMATAEEGDRTRDDAVETAIAAVEVSTGPPLPSASDTLGASPALGVQPSWSPINESRPESAAPTAPLAIASTGQHVLPAAQSRQLDLAREAIARAESARVSPSPVQRQVEEKQPPAEPFPTRREQTAAAASSTEADTTISTFTAPLVQRAEAEPAPISDSREATMAPEAADINLDELSRRVYSQLKRRLAVEWERGHGR